MYVEACYYTEFPERVPVEPRKRYDQYYRDLHARYKINLDDSTLKAGSQYQFSKLAIPLFDQLVVDKYLNKIDLAVFSHWAHEFDPDFTSFGLHLMDKYHLSCDTFDVIDRGSLCTLAALEVILKLNSNQVLCVALDQTTIPRSDASSFVIPSQTAAAALVLSSDKPSKSSLKILDVEIWNEIVICGRNSDLVSFIIKLLKKNNINFDACVLSCMRNSYAYRAINIYKEKYLEFNEKIELDFLSIRFGSVASINYINNLFNHMKSNKRYYVLLEEDVESLTCGAMVIERI